MKTIIEVSIRNDNEKKSSDLSVLLDRDELANIVATQGLEAGNKALDSFVEKFVSQFKQKLGSFLNK